MILININNIKFIDYLINRVVLMKHDIFISYLIKINKTAYSKPELIFRPKLGLETGKTFENL